MEKEAYKKLSRELKFLTEDEKKKELELYSSSLKDKNTNVKLIAKEIYAKRGIDYSKLNNGIFNFFINSTYDLINLFKNKDGKVKKQMIIEIIYTLLLLILIKVPFDLVRDIGYDYIKILSTNDIYYNIWNLAFLVLYTITMICVFVALLRNFINKYKNK